MDAAYIQELIGDYGYAAIAAGTLWDASGLQLFVIAGGAMVGIGADLSPILVVLAGAAGNLGSDLIFYGIGRWRAGWCERVVTSEKGKARLVVLERAVQRYTWPLLVLGRFLPWFGRLVPVIAGLRRLDARRTFPALIVGGFVASIFYTTLGYFAGNTLKQLEGASLWIVLGALVLSVPVGALVVKWFERAVGRLLEAKDHAENSTTNGR